VAAKRSLGLASAMTIESCRLIAILRHSIIQSTSARQSRPAVTQPGPHWVIRHFGDFFDFWVAILLWKYEGYSNEARERCLAVGAVSVEYAPVEQWAMMLHWGSIYRHALRHRISETTMRRRDRCSSTDRQADRPTGRRTASLLLHRHNLIRPQ